jgi:hypothetical protein
MSSVRYGTRLGDLKENWFLLFSNQTLNTHTEITEPKRYEMNGTVRLGRRRPGVARTVSSKDVVGEEY